MSDAWGRRIARNWSSMPPTMQMAFIVSFKVQTLSLWVGLSFLFASMYVAFMALSNSWLLGGGQLIDSAYLPTALTLLFLAPVAQWVVPGIVNMSVYTWYVNARDKRGEGAN